MMQLTEHQKTEIGNITYWAVGFCALWVLLDRIIARTKLGTSSAKDRTEAVYRLVGLVHHTIQLPIAFLLLSKPEFWKDRVHTSSPLSHLLLRISSGYFLHDTIYAIWQFEVQGIGYVIHGLGCFGVYGYSLLQEPGVYHYYGAGFILWEISSYFVHFRWFMFKLNRNKLQMANGFALVISFFLCRIVWGFYLSALWILYDSHLVKSKVYIYTLLALMAALNSLNVYWFAHILKKASDTLKEAKRADKRD